MARTVELELEGATGQRETDVDMVATAHGAHGRDADGIVAYPDSEASSDDEDDEQGGAAGASALQQLDTLTVISDSCSDSDGEGPEPEFMVDEHVLDPANYNAEEEYDEEAAVAAALAEEEAVLRRGSRRRMRLGSRRHFSRLMECRVCYTESGRCPELECGCQCCQACTKRHWEVQVTDGLLTPTCPVCSEPTPTDALQRTLSADLFRRLQERIVAHEATKRVAEDPKLTWCPRPDCNTAVRQRGIRPTVTCTTCHHKFCFRCSQTPHGRYTCDAAAKRRAKETGDMSEVEFKSWAKGATRRCPESSCRARIERAVGQDGDADCNHMICSKCGTEWCWLCQKKIPPIGHFDPLNAFGCPGLQYAAPNVKARSRATARVTAAGRRTLTGARNVAVVGSAGVLALIALPFVAVVGIPYGAIKGIRRLRNR